MVQISIKIKNDSCVKGGILWKYLVTQSIKNLATKQKTMAERIIQCTKCGFTIEAEGENKEYNIKTFIENDILFFDKARVGEKMKKDEFEKLLNDARECYEKAKNLEIKAFDEITDALHGEDLMTITTTVNKAENLEQALWDYIHGCGTGNVDMLWHDITHRDMEV